MPSADTRFLQAFLLKMDNVSFQDSQILAVADDDLQ